MHRTVYAAVATTWAYAVLAAATYGVGVCCMSFFFLRALICQEFLYLGAVGILQLVLRIRKWGVAILGTRPS